MRSIMSWRAARAAAAITSRLVDAHREVFLSLARRDPDQAERALREHFLIGDELRRKNLISNYQPQEMKS